MTGHTSLPMDVERPWLWFAGTIGLLAVSVGAGYVLMGTGQGTVEFRVTNAPAEEPVDVTVARDNGDSLEQVHRTTVAGPQETAWTATESGYYRVTLATADQSCTYYVPLEVVDDDLTAVNDNSVEPSGCPGTLLEW